MAEERKQSLRLWIWRGTALLVVLVFFASRYLLRDQLPVREVQVRHEQLTNTVSTNGRVEPESNYELHAPISTTVKEVYVQPGDLVQKGKLLMVLDDVQARARLASAESGVKSAQAALEAATHNGTLQERQASEAEIARDRLDRDHAQEDLQALVKLNSTGAASLGEIGAARDRLQSSEAALQAAERSSRSRYSPAEVARAEATLTDAQANLAAARQVVDETLVRAPAAGTVYAVGASRTEFVEQGKLLAQIADLSQERVRAYFDEPEIGRLAVGQKIQVKWDAKPGQEWAGKIIRTPKTVITYGTRNVGEVLIDLDDGVDQLLPDTNVTVTVTTSSEPNALSVPREVLHSENGKPFVFKELNGQLKRTPVTTGTINLTQVSILSGLNDGDWVATGATNGQPLQEGVPIKAVR